MSTKPLSTRSLLELLDLFEHSNHAIADAEGQRLHGMPGWAFLDRTSLSDDALAAWTECVGYAGCYPAPWGEEHVPVELEEDEDPTRYRYRCPETFRTKFIRSQRAAVYAIAPERLLGVVADLLDIPRALRHGIERPTLEGTLWHLGKARIGPAYTEVWFVRGLARSVEAVFRYFHSTPQPEQGLILTSGPPLPACVRAPRDYRAVPLGQVLIDHAATPRLDSDRLHRTLTTPAEVTLRPAVAVHFDEYTHTLTLRTKTKPWVIKGERQAAAVRYMCQQAKNDRWLLSAAEILGAAYPERHTARSQRMQNLFRGNTEWTDYIDNPEKGKYRFRLD